MFGGIVTTDGTSTETCESITANLDGDGVTLILGTSIAVSQFDTCSTLIFSVNDTDQISFTCVDKGSNIVTLSIEDRKGKIIYYSVACESVDIHDWTQSWYRNYNFSWQINSLAAMGF